MTSNIGSDMILNGIEQGEISEEAKQGVNILLRASFRPEFLNRLDEIVFYKPLTRADIDQIVDLLVESLRKRMADKRLKLEITDRAKEYIAESGYDPVYGARPLKRFIQSNVETLVARFIIKNDPLPDTTIVVDHDGSELIVK